MSESFEFKYDLKPSADLMELYLVAELDAGPYENQLQLIDGLERMKVTADVDQEAIKAVLDADKDSKPERTLIATAKKSIDGKDGFIKLEKEISEKPVFIPEEEGEKVNYREAIKFQIVQKEEKVGTLVAPVQGENGHNLFGTELPFEPGKTEKFELGNGIKQEGNEFIATMSGRPRYKDNIFEILEVLEIEENINMKTGNIRYPGMVIVHGDLEDTFEIHAGSDVKIMGTMGDSKVVSKGNVTIAGGIVGSKTASVNAEGNVEMKFAQNATIDCKGEVLITKEARHCIIRSNQWVKSKGSGLIGGECTAKLGVDIQVAGADSNPKTIIKLGYNPEMEKVNDQMKALFKVAESIEKKFNHIIEGAEPLDKEVPLMEEGADVLKKIELRLGQLDKEYEVLKSNDEEVSPELIVHKLINAQVKLLAPNCMSDFTEEYKGSSRWMPDIDSGKFLSGGSS